MPESLGVKYVLDGSCDNNLREEHERVVGSEVPGEKLHTVALQSRDRVLLCRIQSRHHSLRTNVDLVRIQEPVERKRAAEQWSWSGIHVVIHQIIQEMHHILAS